MVVSSFHLTMVLCLILIVTLEPLKRIAYCSGLGADMLKEIILILMLMLMPMLMLMLMSMSIAQIKVSQRPNS